MGPKIDQDEIVRLYQPIPYGKKPKSDDPTASFVGGDVRLPVIETDDHLHLLQLHVPDFVTSSGNKIEKTYNVYASKSASSMNKIFTEGRLNFGGSGAVVCLSRTDLEEQKKEFQKSREERYVTVTKEVKASNDDDDEWGSPNDTSMEELEASLAQVEVTAGNVMATQSSTISKTGSSRKSVATYALSQSREPPSSQFLEDEDDVGLSDGHDVKIQKMLSKYLAEETDTDILAALQGTKGCGGGNHREKDERLGADDRAMLTFTDRLKRSPRQVIRYGGGEPLWSIPVYPADFKLPKSQQHTIARMLPIPTCHVCGTARVFAFQILPSVLSTLRVDRMSNGYSATDFGNIAIYTCPDGCANSEFVVVQQSPDEFPTAPKAQAMDTNDVLIDENAVFDDDDDDDDDDNFGVDRERSNSGDSF